MLCLSSSPLGRLGGAIIKQIMKRKQEAYLSMVRKTVNYLNKRKDIWKTNTVMIEIVDYIEDLYGEILEMAGVQNKKTEGSTKSKLKYRVKLNNTTNFFQGIIRSYAQTIGDLVIYENFRNPISIISRIKDTEIYMRANVVADFAKTNLPQLKNHGMTQKMINKYEKEIAGYKKFLVAPQMIIVERKTATAYMKVLFKKISEQLNLHLDNNMMQYKIEQTEFYEVYKNVKIIYDNPTIHKSLKGKVTNKKTGKPKENVTVTVIPENNPKNTKFKKITSKLGNYEFKTLPEGKCKVIFEKTGCKTITVNSAIFKNNLTRLSVEMEESPNELMIE